MLHYVQVKLLKSPNEIKEQLRRIGILNNDILCQTCHLFQYNKKNYIIHFKEYFGIYSYFIENKIQKFKIKMDENDEVRRNNIILYLSNNGFINFNKSIKGYLESSGNIELDIITQRESTTQYKLRTIIK